MHVLPCPTSLLLVHVHKLCSLHTRFAEGNLWTAGRADNAVPVLHSLDINLKVDLAHSQYDCLTQFHKSHHGLQNTCLPAFTVDVGLERWISLSEPVE
jgi:hypothetical protein